MYYLFIITILFTLFILLYLRKDINIFNVIFCKYIIAKIADM